MNRNQRQTEREKRAQINLDPLLEEDKLHVDQDKEDEGRVQMVFPNNDEDSSENDEDRDEAERVEEGYFRKLERQNKGKGKEKKAASRLTFDEDQYAENTFLRDVGFYLATLLHPATKNAIDKR